MSESVEQSRSDLESVLAKWSAMHAEPPPQLYHYTNADGLLGILASNSLIATNARFTNDVSEIQYAMEVVRDVLVRKVSEETAKSRSARRQKDEPPPDNAAMLRRIFHLADRAFQAVDNLVEEVRSFPGIIRQWITDTLSVFDVQGGAYVACFCEDGDLLSQWRGYAAVGAGYSLAFRTEPPFLPVDVPEGKGQTLLRRVIYDRRVQEEVVGEWITCLFWYETQARKALWRPRTGSQLDKAVVELSPGLQDELAQADPSLEQVFIASQAFLAECLLCFKHPAYQEEREVAFDPLWPRCS